MKVFYFGNSLPVFSNVLLLIIRVFIGFAMLTHGFPKLQQLISGTEIKFFNLLGLGDKYTLILAVFAEFACSIFVILGLFTRWALFFLIITMSVAGLLVHGSDAFEKRELSLLYLAVYVLFLVIGPGKFSIDQLIRNK